MKREINNKSLRILRLFYKTAQKKIMDKLQSGSTYSRSQRMRIIEGVKNDLNILSKKTNQWINKEIDRNYNAGSMGAFVMLKSVEDKIWQKKQKTKAKG